MSLTVTNPQFRADFPEFGDATAYPDALVTSSLLAGCGFINETRWGALAALGAELVAAHFLVLEKRALASAQSGSLPGEVKGLLSSKSVGGVSVSYDLSAVTHAGDGFWNQTSYGVRYRLYVRLVGAGPVQFGSGWPGCC